MPTLTSKRGKLRYVGTVWVNGQRGPTKWFPDDSKKSYKAAVKWEAEAEAEFRKNLARQARDGTATGSLTIEQWVDSYLDYVMQNGFTNKTYKEKRAAFKRLAGFTETRPDMPVAEIDRYLAAGFFNAQLAGRTGNAVNKDRKNLGTAWAWGRENLRGWPQGENPFLAVAKKAEARQARYVPPEADFWKVYDYVAGLAESTGADMYLQDRVMLLAYLHLAARRTELFRARLSDVDLAGKRIRLWTKKREGGAMEYDWLPLTVELAADLKMWIQRRLAHATEDKEHLFVCLSPAAVNEQYYGRPFIKRSHVIARWCKQAATCPHCGGSFSGIDLSGRDPVECPHCSCKVPPDQARITPFGWHGIRHLTASTLYRRGYSLGHIQAVLRHKSATTTNRYLQTIGIDEVRETLDEGLQREAKVIALQPKQKASGPAS